MSLNKINELINRHFIIIACTIMITSCVKDPVLIPPEVIDIEVIMEMENQQEPEMEMEMEMETEMEPEVDSESDPLNTIYNYRESFEDFPNPERGFYKYSETRASNYSPLSVSQLRGYRENLAGGSGASYQTYKTIIFRYFVLDKFVDNNIDSEFLNNVQQDFETAREAGVKLIPRFCYTTTATSGSCPESFICPPYGDASKAVVLRHIDQLSPIINDNVDVINCIQMGFIGTWGENYYSDHFGDASSNGGVGKVLDENWTDRIEVLKAMLDNWDKEIMIQVRYVQMKQRALFGIDTPTNIEPMSIADAFSGEDISRIAYHNDCLFASSGDFGTFEDYGNSDSARRGANSVLRSYFYEDSRFVIVGGETCSDGYSPQNNCSPEGSADEVLRQSHYTFLNIDYNNSVNNDWVDGGCMESIILNLGYRFVLRKGKFEKELSEDGIFNVSLQIENVGYAPVLKERTSYLVFVNNADGSEFSYAIDDDMRFWDSVVDLDLEIDIQSNLSAGEYDIKLFLPDHNPSIESRPEYAIRLANQGVWNGENGYNDLGHTIVVN